MASPQRSSPQAKPSPEQGFRIETTPPGLCSSTVATSADEFGVQAHALCPSPPAAAAASVPLPSARRLRRLISAEDLLRDLPPLDPALASSRHSTHARSQGNMPHRDPALDLSPSAQSHDHLEHGQRQGQGQRRAAWPRCRVTPDDQLADVIIPSAQEDSAPSESYWQEKLEQEEQVQGSELQQQTHVRGSSSALSSAGFVAPHQTEAEAGVGRAAALPSAGLVATEDEEVGDVDLRLLECKLELLSLRRHISAVKCQAFLAELQSLQVSGATSAAASVRRRSLDATSASLRRSASSRSPRRQSLDSLAAPKPRRSRTRPRGQLSLLQRTSSSIPVAPAASLSYPNLSNASLADPFGQVCNLYSPPGSGLVTDQHISLSAFSTPTRKHKAPAAFSGTFGFGEL